MTFAGALAWCWIYDRHPNLLPLALSHALLTLAILCAFDEAMTGHLRVGAGISGCANIRHVRLEPVHVPEHGSRDGRRSVGQCPAIAGPSLAFDADMRRFADGDRRGIAAASHGDQRGDLAGRWPYLPRNSASVRPTIAVALRGGQPFERAAHESLSANAGNRGDSPHAHAGSVDAGLLPSRCRCIWRCVRASCVPLARPRH